MKAFIGCQQQHSRAQMKGENRVVKPNVQLLNLLDANLGLKIHLFRYLDEIALNLRVEQKALDELFITASFASVFMALMAFLFVHCGEMQSKVFFYSTFLFSKSSFYRLNKIPIHTIIRRRLKSEWISFTYRFFWANPQCRRRSIFLMFAWFVILHSIAA